MNKFSIFLAKHSQKLALLCATTAYSLAYYAQPYYEVITRWSLTKFDIAWEAKPSERILRVIKETCSHFNMTDYQKLQLDIFLTPMDESLVLGSLTSPNGYAFIGLPYFFGYENSLEIPLDSLDFYRPYFPYGPFSKISRERMDLMIIPESALKFLIAREIVRLQATTSTGLKLPLSARGQSLLTVGGVIGSLYLSYQTIFLLNRLMKLPLRVSSPSRLLIYTLLPLFGVFLQHQIILAWRRHCCLRVDQIVSSLGESYRQGGLAYYDWRLRWNHFWAERQSEYKERKKSLRKGDHTAKFDPVAQYQSENEQSTEKKDKIDYHLPQLENSAFEPLNQNGIANTDEPKSIYRRTNRFTDTGNELWAGDGDGVGFGWTGILTIGMMPRIVSGFFKLFSSPATSRQRYTQLTTTEA
uniref:Transmembrane protein 177 n=1 Tax=Trichobilharzia regenti TaxID=157069 RepID=A0AA85J755_TRIRE|nr:unnamed protein product [Trichobilharzia regenti]